MKPKIIPLIMAVVLNAWPQSIVAFADEYVVEMLANDPYKSAIIGDQLMMRYGGVKIYQDEDGKSILVSAAQVVVKNNDATDRLRMLKTARAKAIAEVLKWHEGAQVSSIALLEEYTGISMSGEVETAMSEFSLKEQVQSISKGVVRALPTVATWYSTDYKSFFLAVGSYLSADNYHDTKNDEGVAK